jgi:signal transduction histidine kinase/HAMP domain-containing protein
MRVTTDGFAGSPDMTAPATTAAVPSSGTGRVSRFFSLRAKFVAFFSVTLIIASSALSWYFVETRRAAMVEGLHELGTVLLTNTLRNDRFRFAGLIAEDARTIEEFVDGLMAVDHVAYVVITGVDGRVLATKSKLRGASATARTPATDLEHSPLGDIAKDLRANPVRTPLVTRLSAASAGVLRPAGDSTGWLWPLFNWHETLYDFAQPVLRRASPRVPLLPYGFEGEAPSSDSGPNMAENVTGVVQIGLTDALVKEGLVTTIRHVMLLTAFIIFAGILGAHLFTLRITTPLHSLTGAARRLAEGGAPEHLTPTTHDEIGQLTGMFNVMTESLRERNQAINNHVELIRRQVSQLTTVHETGTAIARTLNLRELLDTVLQLLMTNLGFSRMVLMLRREDRAAAYVARIAGISPAIAEAAYRLEIPIRDDETILSDLFLHGTPVLANELSAEAHRMHPETLGLAQAVGIRSFVAVPLQSQNRILGMLGADRGDAPCNREDLTVLKTIASHVAAAIDNARAYAHLTELTQHLEQRIEERTRELSVANQRLQEHDRRRTMFVSTASHELRTPMTAIRSFTDNMLDGVAGALTPQQSTYLNRIAHNLNRLTRIINQLLDWSALDLKKEKLHVESLCVRQISGLVVDSLRTVADQKQITIEMQTNDELPAVLGDRDKIEQILWNLVGNAVKFTPPGGRVVLSFDPGHRDSVQISVADTGCGIAPEHVGRVFDEFSKVPSAIPTSQGAQLGLFITKSYVEMQGGRIWVQSELGAGTRFSFTLPCASGSRGSAAAGESPMPPHSGAA